MTGFVIDCSGSHPSGAKLNEIGCTGAIGYVSDYPWKNLPQTVFDDWRAHAIEVGLVWENGGSDLLGGAATGDYEGRRAVEEAGPLGYDYKNAVIYNAGDFNSHPADFPSILAGMEAFAGHVPIPGYYGNQGAIDYLHARYPDWYYWQSNSSSYSNGLSPNAHLQQLYNDPVATPLGADKNNIQRAPWGGMGDDMPAQITDPGIQFLAGKIGDLAALLYGNPAQPDATHPYSLLFLMNRLNAIDVELGAKIANQVDVTALAQQVAADLPANLSQQFITAFSAALAKGNSS